jgi:hypothetical protein
MSSTQAPMADKRWLKLQSFTPSPLQDSRPLSVLISSYSALIDLQYNTTQGLDFTIRGGRIASTNFLGISILLLQDRRWERIRVSYFVNSRSDIWAGSFTTSTFSL